MALEKAKLFWKPGDQAKMISPIPYNDKMDYYFFVRDQYNAGFRQIIVSSDVMIQLITKIVIAQFRILAIEVVEDNEKIDQQIRILLERIEKDAVYLSELVTLLRFLSEKSSIAIKRIDFRGLAGNGITVDGFVQSNGVLGANRELSNTIFRVIGTEVGSCLFGG